MISEKCLTVRSAAKVGASGTGYAVMQNMKSCVSFATSAHVGRFDFIVENAIQHLNVPAESLRKIVANALRKISASYMVMFARFIVSRVEELMYALAENMCKWRKVCATNVNRATSSAKLECQGRLAIT